MNHKDVLDVLAVNADAIIAGRTVLDLMILPASAKCAIQIECIRSAQFAHEIARQNAGRL